MRDIQGPVFRESQCVGTARDTDTFLTDASDPEAVFCLKPMLPVAGNGYQPLPTGDVQRLTVKEAPVGGDIADFHPGQDAVTVNQGQYARVLMDTVDNK